MLSHPHHLMRAARPRVYAITGRTFTVSRSVMFQAEDLSISKGEDNDAVLQQTSRLIDNGKWQLCNDGKGIERAFKFRTFRATWDFMNRVAAECKKQKHHPEWSNVYNKTHIRWTTHSPEGLSHRDTHMAQICDEAGQEFGELPMDQTECQIGSDGKIQAGDCCTRKV